MERIPADLSKLPPPELVRLIEVLGDCLAETERRAAEAERRVSALEKRLEEQAKRLEKLEGRHPRLAWRNPIR